MLHNWNNRSRRSAFGLCFAVLILPSACCLGTQDATESPSTSVPKFENPFDLLPTQPESRQPEVSEWQTAEELQNAAPKSEAEKAAHAKEPQQPPPNRQLPNAQLPDSTTVETKPVDDLKLVDGRPLIDKVLTERYSRAMIIDFNGPIFGAQHAYLNNRLDRAQRTGVDLVIIRLTSPGGLLEESVQLARRLSEIDWATTVAFIPEEAISGGAIIALGCDRIYLRPRGLIGDAGPIVLGPDGMFEHVEEKRVSYLHVALSELAESKGRPSALASAMADRSLKVFPVKNKESGEMQYLSTEQIAKIEISDDFEVGSSIPEAGENRFLTVDGTRALELNLAEGIFESETELLAALNFEARVDTRMNWVDRTVYLLNRPWLSGLLLFVALIALYIEIAAPGISVAGLTSLACFGVFFWSHALGGTSGWLEVLIFVLGVLCIVVEIFLLPGFGVFGLSGILLVLLSLIMATQDFVLPNNPAQWRQLQTNSIVVLGSIAVVSILFIGQLLLLDSLPGLKRFQLGTPSTDLNATATESILSKSPVDLILPQVGEQGVAESVLRPSGKVLFDQRLVDVITEGDFLDPGTSVEVIRREGNRIVVRKLG
jgi:membrane-bound serine protease (ClpP class)